MGAYTGLRYWLLLYGPILLAGFGALYIANGAIIGWKTTYDVAIGIKSPGDDDITAPTLAWFLSVAGWLAAPAVFGAVVGAVIASAVNGRRRRPIGEVLVKDGAPR